MHIYNMHDAKTRLSELVKRALAGEEVIIARHNQPLVKLEPVNMDVRPRTGGQWKGKIWMAPDFDAPDPEIERLFYGEEG